MISGRSVVTCFVGTNGETTPPPSFSFLGKVKLLRGEECSCGEQPLQLLHSAAAADSCQLRPALKTKLKVPHSDFEITLFCFFFQTLLLSL